METRPQVNLNNYRLRLTLFTVEKRGGVGGGKAQNAANLGQRRSMSANNSNGKYAIPTLKEVLSAHT